MEHTNFKWIVCYFLMLLFMLIPFSNTYASNLNAAVTDVPTDKIWTITFNGPVVKSSIAQDSIYIINSQKEKQSVKFEIHENKVIIYPPETGYIFNEKYTIHIQTTVLGQINDAVKPLKKSVNKPFTTTKGYAVVNINADATPVPATYYSTYDDAIAHLQAGQGIMLNKKYIKIPAGFVATNNKAVTVLYTKPSFTGAYEYTGVGTDTELIYIDSTASYVKVLAAGQEMYVRHADVTLIPKAKANGQSYYIADEKGLWHYIYHHLRGKYDTAYLIGKAPSFMQQGIKYYSTDGATFTDSAGNVLGESYAYFQYLSPRVPTSYSAAQLDEIIDKQLADREKSGNSNYENATTKSPIRGLGSSLKAIEKDEQINALLLLAMAIHESNYGMSCHALNYNNLFGFNVTDTNTQCSSNVDTSNSKYFKTIEDNLMALVSRLNTSYINPLNMADYRYNGLALGNKMVGMNVRYASDPYWGEKIAGHMYRLDQSLGGQDYQKYKIGITTSGQVSMRSEPIIKSASTSNVAYQYKLDWTIKRLDRMPITLSNTPSEQNGWLRVISEQQQSNKDVYTAIENVRMVNTH